jgi:sugar O-acyltransferase (sialic acid O-acetyltransferase NeuD family)
MAKVKILLIGGGGHCKSAIDVIEQTDSFEIVGIIDIKEKVGDLLFGYQILGTDSEIASLQKNIDACHISLGMIYPSDKRAKLFNELKTRGFKFPIIQSPLAYVSKHATIGEGTIIMHHVIVNAGAHVGENCILNTKSLIEHDAIIGNHTHIATGTIINGGVTVGEGSFIGSGSVSKQGSIVPACSFIKANSIIK